MGHLIVRGGEVVTSQGRYKADVIAQDGYIVGTSQQAEIESGDEVVDAEGCYVLPGLIDAHTHIRLDTGVFQTDDSWYTGTRAAAYGGVTTVIDFATQLEGQTFHQALKERMKETEPALIDYGLHCMVTDLPHGEEYRLGDLVALGMPSFKLYTTYRPNYYADDVTIYRLFLAAAGLHGLLPMVHCENDSLVAAATQDLIDEGKTAWRYHGKARPAYAEAEATRRVLYLAEVTDVPVYIVHCSTQDAVAAVVKARANGQLAYAETCPQYLFLDESVYESEQPEKYILQPPIRSADHVEGLWNFIDQGEVDVISSDHCDYTLGQKRAHPEFTRTPGGLPGLETTFALLFASGKIKLERLVGLLCERPARIFGLYPRKGALLPGSDADMLVYNPESERVLRAENLHQRAGYTPYEGVKVRGNVRAVIGRGEVLVRDGELFAREGRGLFLHRRIAKNSI
jgi:dihydropyrimidinase